MRTKCLGEGALSWGSCEVLSGGKQLITQKESSCRGASRGWGSLSQTATNLAGRKGRAPGSSCQVTAVAAAPADPTGPSSRPEAGEMWMAALIQLFWVIPSIWHHIWCQRFGYCFTHFISHWVLRDEASHPPRQGVWKKSPLLSKSSGHKVNPLLWLL